ncbi:DUF305 domain-containing protein [Streptomyces sp. NBC_01803]|uniref:DUF305 domain-containing protein n=1 Tax=Streptomyces sp. NBC_01803 TaxID=2975946 RepID=UPI002DD7EA4A|nr:DUF305 domain-containing protein [Streptomyces sp. NBC_01803]WSA42861.1 DUF305 domain-containing protein [Streptomyces sp. NBC_01803]
MTDRRRLRTGTALAALAALALVGGCTGASGSDDGAGADRTPPVIAPGAPGEAAETLSPEEAAERGAREGEPTAEDFAFMRMMAEHHGQALVMTELAGRHAEDEAVLRLSERVTAEQGPEIDAMNAWLTRNAGAAADDGGHGTHDGGEMPGMATEEQLAELSAARGEEFDALFLDLMIAHHEGAVTMAAEVLTGAGDVTVQQMANDMIAAQSVEIGRMEELRQAGRSR